MYEDLTSSFTMMIIIIMIFTLAIVIILIYIYQYGNKKTIDTLKKLAIKYNGTLKKDSKTFEFISGRSPRLIFTYKNFSISMYAMLPQQKGKWPRTVIKASFISATNPRMIIYRRNRREYSRNILDIGKTRDLQTRETGLTSFDNEYVIKTDTPELIHKYVKGRIQTTLLDMYKLNPFIMLKPGQLQITFPKYFTKENEFDTILNFVMLFCDEIRPIT